MIHKIPHIIKMNKTTQISKRHLFVDTETITERINDTESYLKFKMGWALLWTREVREGRKEFEWYFIKDINDFWAWLESRINDKEKITWWSHNTDFDFRILNGYVKMKELGYGIKNPIVDSGLTILNYHKPNKTLLVLDTFNFFKSPLSVIGESMGEPKGNVDFSNVTDDKLKEYCKQDVKILYKTIRGLINFIVEHDLGTLKKTVAAQAFTAYRHRFMKFPIHVHVNPKAMNLERNSYRGGRCEAFFIGDVANRDLRYLDVNSMYPYVMEKYNYPTKLVRVLNDVSVRTLEKLMKQYLVIADINFNINVTGIAVKTSRLVFPIGCIDASVCTEELKYILKHGKINNIRTVAIYESAPIFKDYVKYFYDLRTRYKKEGNKSYTMFTKYMLNTLYGKWGQHTTSLVAIKDLPDNSKESTTQYFDMDSNRWVTEYHFNNKAWIKTGKRDGFDTFTAIASEVTSNARMLLQSYIECAGCENVYYCDTDSLIVSPQGYDNLLPFIHPTTLGLLGEESLQIKGIFGAKWYETNEGVKLKGVKNAAVKVGENMYKQQQFERFNTGIRKGDMDKIRVKDVIKRIKTVYNKGNVGKNGWISPYNFVMDNLTTLEIKEKNEEETRKKERALDKNDKAIKKSVKSFMKESDNYDEDKTLTLEEEKIEDAKNSMRAFMM